MLLEQVDTTAPKIANSLAREQKARRSRFIATRASRSAAWESQLDMIRPFQARVSETPRGGIKKYAESGHSRFAADV